MATSETTWNLPPDARKNGMKYPNYNIMLSPSGNGMVVDDSKGAESLTIFHRNGSKIQFQPDGSMVIINKKDSYHVTFGDHNVMITGAHNITVNGGCQMKVEGDYDLTVHGNAKHTIKGNLETVVNGDMTTAVKGQQETVVGGSISTKAVDKHEIIGNKTAITGESKIGVLSPGQVDIHSEGDTNIQASGNINNTSSKLYHNSKDVGDDHKHSGVTSGASETGVPV